MQDNGTKVGLDDWSHFLPDVKLSNNIYAVRDSNATLWSQLNRGPRDTAVVK